MSQIKIEIGAPDAGVAEKWDELVSRAAGNVFMHPVALSAAACARIAKIHVLHAWLPANGHDRLVGMWALQERRIAPLCPRSLAAPPHEYAFLSNPVVDRVFAREVIRGFFDAIESSSELPNIIRLRYLDGDGEVYAAIIQALNDRDARTMTLSHRERAFASKEHGRKGSGSTRKKLRQTWNRLSALGKAEVVNDRSPAAVQDAFEIYLAMEANSWKGEQRTALLSDARDAAFARKLIGDLAERNSASVALLRCNGEPIAAQVLLYCAGTAYTWKTAFNSDYAKYSPGALLVDKITDHLFSEGGISAMESCSPEGGFMSQLWEGRRPTIDLLADVGTKESLNFILAAIEGRGYTQLRGLRDRIRSAGWPSLPRRKSAVVTRQAP